MKKLIMLLAVVLISGMSFAGGVPEGAGATGTATTTPVYVEVPGTNYCRAVSIDNEGSVAIRFVKKLAINSTTNGFTVATALVVPAGKSYTIAGGTMMNEDKQRNIFGVVLATESSTADYSINFE